MAGHDQAETYLRLMAETELRRALAAPPYEPPGPPRVPGPLIAAYRVANPVISRLSRTMTPLIWSTARVSPALRHVLPGHRRYGPPGAMQNLNQVRTIAGALTVVGAIDDATADSVLSGLESALAVRSRLASRWADGLGRPRWSSSQPPAPGLPGGPVRVAPVGRSLPLGADGSEGDLHLLTLVLAPDRAILTVAGQVREPDPRFGIAGRDVDPGDPFEFGDGSVTDDRGAAYQAEASGGTSDDTWWCRDVDITPVPPAGTRWLDITAPGGTATLRVDLTTVSPADQPVAARPAWPGRIGDASPAERLLDSMAENLLWQSLMTRGRRGHAPPGLTGIVAALEAVGALKPGSAALDRLAALSGRLGAALPAGLAAAARAAALPVAWDSVLAERDRQDGRGGVAPAAAVLPETDGARFATAGLCSTSESAILHVLAWGWRPQPDRFNLGQETFSWWARDDTGRWHVGRETSASVGSGQADLDITFVPPLHPATAALEIFLTGPSAQATATVPIEWQAGP